MTSTGNVGLDVLADAIARRVVEIMADRDTRLMTVKQAAEYLGLSQKAVRHKIAEGTIPAVREGSRVRLDRGDLDHWIDLRRARS
jgi:excisionase family DNA binding protein